MKKAVFSTLTAAFVLIAVTGFTAHRADYQSGLTPLADKATLRVTSTTETPITFEANYEGASLPEDGRFIESRQTPFEIEVDGQDFRGVFHKTGGAGRMKVAVEGPGWSLEGRFNVTTIILDDGEHTTLGLP